MKKKDIFRIVLGGSLCIINTIVIICKMPDWYSNGILATTNGLIVIPLVFPVIAKWAYAKRKTNPMLAVFVVGFLVMVSSIWLVFTVLELLGIITDWNQLRMIWNIISNPASSLKLSFIKYDIIHIV